MRHEADDSEYPKIHANCGAAMPELICKTPDVIGGDACIGMRRIAVWMVVRAKQLGLSDEAIRNRYEQPLTEAELAAAWKYYADHREEIEKAIRENEEA
jgi:uncharacterized protein (DUF433 family)